MCLQFFGDLILTILFGDNICYVNMFPNKTKLIIIPFFFAPQTLTMIPLSDSYQEITLDKSALKHT